MQPDSTTRRDGFKEVPTQGRSVVPDSVVVRAPAKLNLFLELLGKRPDGFHELETIMVPVSCSDTLHVSRSDRHQEIRLRTHWWPSPADWRESLGEAAEPLLAIPDDASNLIYRAIEATRSAFGISGGFDVIVRKRIPAGAGMGGASSDAAAAIQAVAALGRVDADHPELAAIAAQIGSDVPFFLGHGLGSSMQGQPWAALATGRGERLQPFQLARRLWFVVAYPRGGLSTAAVYGRVQLPQQPVAVGDCLAALAAGDLHALRSAMLNRLSEPAQALSPQVSELLGLMDGCGLAAAMMTGSGSACFSVFAQRQQAIQGAQRLREQWSRSAQPGRVLVVSSLSARPRVRLYNSEN